MCDTWELINFWRSIKKSLNAYPVLNTRVTVLYHYQHFCFLAQPVIFYLYIEACETMHSKKKPLLLLLTTSNHYTRWQRLRRPSISKFPVTLSSNYHPTRQLAVPISSFPPRCSLLSRQYSRQYSAGTLEHENAAPPRRIIINRHQSSRMPNIQLYPCRMTTWRLSSFSARSPTIKPAAFPKPSNRIVSSSLRPCVINTTASMPSLFTASGGFRPKRSKNPTTTMV